MPKTNADTTKQNELNSSKKTTSTKIASTTKVKSSTSKTAKKTTNVKKSKTSTTTTKSTTATSKSKSTKKSSSTSKKKNSTLKKSVANKKAEIIEYYDLPYGYNQTVVKILAQTPNTLFVYWDISEDDRKKYIKDFGDNFFEVSKPILIFHNKTKNYSFEIEINDFANCWYFNTADANCEYEIELGRKANILPNNYLPITYSNIIETPNNHILFEETKKTAFFRNVKTNQVSSKNIANLQFIRRIGKIYNIYDIYKKIYGNENFKEVNNPTSNFN